MSASDLRSRYAEVFGETTNTRHKEWLIKRIIYRMQALAEGDLSERARQRAAELANAVFRAFKLRADVTVHLEDDTVPSPDALRYFDWAVRELLIPDVKSPDGLPDSAGLRLQQTEERDTPRPFPRLQHPPDLDAVGRGGRPIAAELANRQLVLPQPQVLHLPVRRTRREVFPILSRIQNIGYEKGEDNRSPEWYRANHRTPWVAGQGECRPFSL
jgi:hypothetical protein